MIKINMEKAREIQRNAVRKERAALLADLDVMALRSLGDQQALAEIEVKKQALRDAPASNLIADAQTPEELKQATLEKIMEV